jgi:flagellin-like protein
MASSCRIRKASAIKGVSPIIATLLLIVITVAGAVVTYGFVSGFIGGAQAKPIQTGIAVDSVYSSPTEVILYVRNTGNAPLTVDMVYVTQGNSLVAVPLDPTVSVGIGSVSPIILSNNFTEGPSQFKITSTEGAQCVVSSNIPAGSGSSGDLIPPLCSSLGANTTIAGTPCLLSSIWNDTVGLSGFICSTNNSGSWVNSSWTPFTGNTASLMITLDPTIGSVMDFEFFANDTYNNWGASSISYITLTSLAINCMAIIQNSSRVGTGSAVALAYHLVWSSNSSAVASGTLTVNGTGYTISGGWCNFTDTSATVTKRTYAVTSVNANGVTAYSQSPPNPSIIWDRLNITYTTNSTLLSIKQTAQITITATYEYDGATASLTVNTLRNGTHYATGNFADYESAAAVFTYSVENFTDPLYGITAFDSTPLTVTWTIAPPGVVAYVPIMLTNNQNLATPANFQQQLFINWSLCSPYVSSSLSNVIFFDSNGNLLYGWDENGTTNASNSLTVVWVNLGSDIIPANGNINIYLGFYNLSYDSRGQNGYWGMFPTATGTYAQYDNGFKVFLFYDNFNGTTISPAWNTQGAAGTYSVNNGLTMYSGAFPNYVFTLNNQYTSPIVVDAYSVGTYGNWLGISLCNLQSTDGSYTITSGAAQWLYPPEGGWGSYNGLSSASGYTAITHSPITTTTQVISLAMNSTTAIEYQDYANPATVSVTGSLSNYPGLVQLAYNTASDTQTTYWFRLRVLPPNMVMPGVSLGGIVVL